MDFKRTAIAIAIAVVAVSGCGGGGSGGTTTPPPPQTSVSGIVFSSAAFTSGVVKAYEFSSGTQGALLSSSTIGTAGTYKLNVPTSSSAILIEADSGCYTETAIQWLFSTFDVSPSTSNEVTASVCTGLPSLSAVVSVAPGTTTMVAAITPYTHAAVGLAEYEIRTGSSVSMALADANSRMSQWVGANIQTTIPVAPVRTSAISAATLYGGLLDGIPSWLYNVATGYPVGSGAAAAALGTGSLTTLAFANAMKSDLDEDGILNGTGRDANGNAVALTIGNSALTTTIYRHEMALYAVIRERAETEGAATPTAADDATVVSFMPAFNAYNTSTNTMLDASAVVALDENGPLVIITSPLAGATMSANQGMNGYVYDCVGIPIGGTLMLIDGVLYTPFQNQYMPNNFINTTIFANGSHVLTIKTTNNLGHVSTASVTVTFFN